ncbi:fatty acid desaturase [Amantichitinum ursilacus]|uniref:Fatty acid desaturase n=1 Tax=Amantichitinum ursilacus TaxID=857265 RepID=A0A0N0GMN4_9NEIS|nr:fatty acid desaturase [Amantichitinum ursilacus]KPC51347.1 Fatty acid desaturase [Amantichitinum ursilacus]
MPRPNAKLEAIEWPTWILLLVIYGAWIAAAWASAHMSAWLAVPGLALVLAWYSSLQHELLHGHPTRNAAFNRYLGLLPLAVWYPFDEYKRSHLAHHEEAHLTYPGIDPESNYLAPAAFKRLPRPLQPLRRATRTALGRIFLGPAFAIVATWRDGWRDKTHRAIWLQHLSLLALVAGLLVALHAPLWRYLLASYLALGTSMLRSFYEHRPASIAAHRVVLNEAGWFWRLLFLNNNYHLVHHEQPRLPWYRIAAEYRADRSALLQRNGHFLVPGYGYLLLHYGLRPIDAPTYPAVHVSI